MAGLVIILIVVAVIGSMGFAFYMYNTYQPNLITGTEGDTITVGPVEYVITFEGTHSGVERKANQRHICDDRNNCKEYR